MPYFEARMLDNNYWQYEDKERHTPPPKEKKKKDKMSFENRPTKRAVIYCKVIPVRNFVF